MTDKQENRDKLSKLQRSFTWALVIALVSSVLLQYFTNVAQSKWEKTEYSILSIMYVLVIAWPAIYFHFNNMGFLRL